MATIPEQIQSVKTWIRIMRKETCIRVLQFLEQPCVGTSRVLKIQLRDLLNTENPEVENIVRKIVNLKTKFDEEKILQIKARDPSFNIDDLSDEDSYFSDPEPVIPDKCNSSPNSKSCLQNSCCQRKSELAELMDIVRKWNIKFSGNKNPADAVHFIERIEEISECYDISLDRLPKVMPELLKDAPLDWYRNNKRDWVSWEDFKTSFNRFFVPARLQTNYEDAVEKHLQLKDQSIADYVIAIQTKMRRVKDMTEQKKLDRIYTNMLPEYKLYIRRREFRTLDELLELGDEYEGKVNEQKNHSRKLSSQQQYFAKKPDQPKNYNLLNNYNRNQCCWRCGNRGHRRNECKNRPLLFCSYCGKPSIKTIDCKCSRPKYSTNDFKIPNASQVTINSSIALNDIRPHIEVIIKGRTFKALIDSGANSSFIGKRALDWIKEKHFPYKFVNSKTTLANGTKLPSNFSYKIPLSVNDSEIIHEFLTLDGLAEDVLLGMDLLDRIGFKYSFNLPIIDKSDNSICNVLLNEQISEKKSYLILPFNNDFSKNVVYSENSESCNHFRSNKPNHKSIPKLSSFEKLLFCSISNNIVHYPPCSWLYKLPKKINNDPEKYCNYKIVEKKIFRYFNNQNISKSSWKLCVPKSLRTIIIREYCEKIISCNLSTRKIISSALKYFYWPGIIRDIRSFVKRFSGRLQHKAPQSNISRNTTYYSNTFDTFRFDTPDKIMNLQNSLKKF